MEVGLEMKLLYSLISLSKSRRGHIHKALYTAVVLVHVLQKWARVSISTVSS